MIIQTLKGRLNGISVMDSVENIIKEKTEFANRLIFLLEDNLVYSKNHISFIIDYLLTHNDNTKPTYCPSCKHFVWCESPKIHFHASTGIPCEEFERGEKE